MQRLNDMQLDIETDKQSKLYNLDSQLEQTDQTLSQWHQSNMSQFSQFKEQVTECLKYIEQDKQSREYEHETQLQELEQLKASIEARFLTEKQARKEMEQRLV